VPLAAPGEIEKEQIPVDGHAMNEWKIAARRATRVMKDDQAHPWVFDRSRADKGM
jgi:hypothetical protein